MNILFVSESIWMKGVVYDLHILAEGLSLLGHKVYAIDPGEQADEGHNGVLSSEVREVFRAFPEAKVRLRSPRFHRPSLGKLSINLEIQGVRHIYRFSKIYSEIDKVLKEEKIDMILLYSAARSGIQAVQAAKRYNIPVVFRNVDMLYKLWPTYLERTAVKLHEKYVYPRMDMLLALTPKYKEYLIRLGANEARVELLPFPIDMKQFDPTVDSSEIRHRWGLDDNDQVIVFIGTLYEFGGLVEFTRQFPSVLKQVPKAKLLIVGDGPIRQRLEEIVAELNLSEHIIITGYQPFSQMPHYINAATMCLNVFPINENTKDIFSAKIIQYLSCGKATVSSALSGITTALPSESCGVVYANTIDEVIEKVVDMLRSSDRRKQLEKIGLEFIRQTHSHDKVILRLEEVLTKVKERSDGFCENKVGFSYKGRTETVTNKPLVSILTPVFNANKYLEQCIQSVLSQTYPKIEHIFADGGSTDGTLDILAKYQEKYPDRIRFISGPDKGVGSALNKGYKISKGEIIGWIDSDDVYQTDAVETAIKSFQAKPDVYFLYGGCNIINANSETIGCFVIKDYDLNEWLNAWHYIVFCATFFRRDVIEKVGFVNNLGNDLSFYLRVSKKFKMHRIEKRLTNWRLHDDSISLKRASREHKIRKNRAKEDFFLVLRYGGSIFSPRALTYFAVLEPSIKNALRPFIGFTYPFLKKIAHQVKFSIAVVQQKNGSFAYPLIRNIFNAIKSSMSETLRPRLQSFTRNINYENQLYNSANNGYIYFRAGQRINSIPAGTVVRQISLYMDKVGNPRGIGFCMVRKVSDDSVAGTVGIVDVSTLPATPSNPTWVLFYNNPVKIPNKGDYRIVFEWAVAGGDSSNYPRVRYNSTDTIGGVFTQYSSGEKWRDIPNSDTSIKLNVN